METNNSNKLSFHDLVKTISSKIPNAFLSLQIIITKHIYTDSELTDKQLHNIFWLYYPTLCLMCSIWEYFR